MTDKKEYVPLMTRMVLGLMFLVAGIGKLMNPSGIIGMLSNSGFFLPTFWGWLVILSEILFGGTVLLGWKLKYTTWPLVIVMIVATVIAVLPNVAKSPTGLFFHLLTIVGLIGLTLTGPGKWAIEKK